MLGSKGIVVKYTAAIFFRTADFTSQGSLTNNDDGNENRLNGNKQTVGLD